MEDFIGMIRICPYSLMTPAGYLKCEGQQLEINQYKALFSIIGIIYGGNGKTTFQLPDLRGRALIGHGSTSDFKSLENGHYGGSESVTLTLKNLPPHAHGYNALTGKFESTNPAQNYLGTTPGKFYARKDQDDKLENMSSKVISPAGGNKSHDNMPPYLPLDYIICYDGINPSFE